MGKIKVLTVQFDVTHLDQGDIEVLKLATCVQGESFEVYDPQAHYCTAIKSADVLNTSVREVDVDDV